MNRWLVLAFVLMACFAVAGTAAWLTRSSVETWYPTLRKPPWNPPNWIFGPVWSLLYILMAIAGWRVWQLEPSPRRDFLLTVFFVQLLLNFLWSPLFFRFMPLALPRLKLCFSGPRLGLLFLPRAAQPRQRPCFSCRTGYGSASPRF